MVVRQSTTGLPVGIYWEVNDFATGLVEFGESTSYDKKSKAQLSFKFDIHRQTLSELKPDTTYHYKVYSKNNQGDEVSSIDRTFKTLALTTEAAPNLNNEFDGPKLPTSFGGSWQLVSADKYGWLKDPIEGKASVFLLGLLLIILRLSSTASGRTKW